MSELMRLTSVSNPRVKAVVRLRSAAGSGGRRRTGLFIAEGVRELSRAVQAALRVREIYHCPALLDRSQRHSSLVDPLQTAAHLGADRFEVTEPVFRKMANLGEPQGVLAVVEQPRWTLQTLEPVTDRTLLLVAVGIQKPGNLGAMVRTAEAAGGAGVIAVGPAGGSVVDAFSPQAIRNSTAAVFSLPTIAAPQADALAWLDRHRVRIVATTPAAAAVYNHTDLTGPVAVVIGPEDTGLSDAWLNAAHHRVAIPMHGRLVDSLNASAAAAVVLFEVLRQRAQQPTP